MRTNNRAVGIITKNNEILVLHRIKNNQEYFVFPGGGVESEETISEALNREMQEELSINIKSSTFLFKIFTQKSTSKEERTFYFYSIDKYDGELKLGGPEKDKMSENNQYHLHWIKIADMPKILNLFPENAKLKLIETLAKEKLYGN